MHFTYYECPVCGHGEICRERMYTPKPEAYDDRHKYKSKYDYCNV